MNPRSTGIWLVLAAGLFAFIFLYERHTRKPAPGPTRILSALEPSRVTTIQVLPNDHSEIQAVRSNAGWQLTKPLVYPAQPVSIETLLVALAQLTPVTYMPERELRNRFNADEEYGFANPQAAIVLHQGTHRTQLRIGRRTAPGDQVFLQVVGVEGVYVVDADLLKLVPRTANAWRDATFVDLKGRAIDGIAVTNGLKMFELKKDSTNKLWRMVGPTPARANNARIEEGLQKLRDLRILQFVSDSPKPDLESFKLQPPEWELGLSEGTNRLTVLQFGRPATNDASQIYARRFGQTTIVAVSSNLLASWRDPVNEFRDTHLLTLTEPVDTIEVHAQDTFSIQRQTNNTWRVLPQNFPADSGLVKNLLSILSGMPIVQFVKDAVTEPDLPVYGLSMPSRQFILRLAPAASATNSAIFADLSFGTNQENKVFVRRTDESFVYAVELEEVERLPSASCQLRERRIWNYSIGTLVSVTIRQNGKIRQIIRKGEYQWSLAPGSQGIIDPLPIEETVKGLCQLEATEWLARGEKSQVRYGFETNRLQIALQFKDNEQATLEFGGEAIPGFPYTAVMLDGEPWICRVPLALCRDVLLYLTIPSGNP
jgi:hypothetical protein